MNARAQQRFVCKSPLNDYLVNIKNVGRLKVSDLKKQIKSK